MDEVVASSNELAHRVYTNGSLGTMRQHPRQRAWPIFAESTVTLVPTQEGVWRKVDGTWSKALDLPAQSAGTGDNTLSDLPLDTPQRTNASFAFSPRLWGNDPYYAPTDYYSHTQPHDTPADGIVVWAAHHPAVGGQGSGMQLVAREMYFVGRTAADDAFAQLTPPTTHTKPGHAWGDYNHRNIAGAADDSAVVRTSTTSGTQHRPRTGPCTIQPQGAGAGSSWANGRDYNPLPHLYQHPEIGKVATLLGGQTYSISYTEETVTLIENCSHSWNPPIYTSGIFQPTAPPVATVVSIHAHVSSPGRGAWFLSQPTIEAGAKGTLVVGTVYASRGAYHGAAPTSFDTPHGFYYQNHGNHFEYPYVTNKYAVDMVSHHGTHDKVVAFIQSVSPNVVRLVKIDRYLAASDYGSIELPNGLHGGDVDRLCLAVDQTVGNSGNYIVCLIDYNYATGTGEGATTGNGFPNIHFTRYHRASDTWEPWEQITDSRWGATDWCSPIICWQRYVQDETLRLALGRHTSSTDLTAGEVVLYSRPNPRPPYAPHITTPSGTYNVNEPLTIDWDFTDPNVRDTQAKFELSRITSEPAADGSGVMALSARQWLADISPYVFFYSPMDDFNVLTSAETEITLPSTEFAQWADGRTTPITYQVRVYDSTGLGPSPWSNVLTVQPTTPIQPVITAPTAGQVPQRVDLTWTAEQQTAYRVRMTKDQAGLGVIVDTGLVVDSNTRAVELVADRDGVNRWFDVQIWNNENYPSERVQVAVNFVFVPPALPSVRYRSYPDNGGFIRVRLVRPRTNPPGAALQEHVDLWRRETADVTGAGIRVFQDVTDGNSTFDDYTVGSSVSYQYKVIVFGVDGTRNEASWKT